MRIPAPHISITQPTTTASAAGSASAAAKADVTSAPGSVTPPGQTPADCFTELPPSGGVPVEAPLPERIQAAPPDFEVDGVPARFTDVTNAEVDFTLDVGAKQASVHSRLELTLQEEGYPVLDLVPDVTGIRVNGEEVDPALFELTEDPDGVTQMRVLKTLLPPGDHVIEFEYAPTEDIRFTEDGVDFEIEMDDLAQRKFLEQYFPASFEYDQHPTTMNLNIVGAGREHKVMTNGALEELGDGSYRIQFPETFTSSSHFLHIIDPSRYVFLEQSFQGLNGEVPVRVYSDDPREAESAMRTIIATMTELEETYGPYAHNAFTAFIGGRTDGMEYAGATQSSLWALEHEIAHSWFARGVFGNSGNTGWLDEAIVSWRDNGYPTARSYTDQGNYPPLASFSPYRRDTSEASYSHGARIMSELDLILREQGGLRPVLREFYGEYRNKVVTTQEFIDFVQERAPVELDTYFRNKVYGGRDPEAQGLRGSAPAPYVPVDEWFHAYRRRPSVLR